MFAALCTSCSVMPHIGLTLKILSDRIQLLINDWQFCPNKQFLHELQLCFRISLFFTSLAPPETKISQGTTHCCTSYQSKHTKSGNSTLKLQGFKIYRLLRPALNLTTLTLVSGLSAHASIGARPTMTLPPHSKVIIGARPNI